MGREEVRRALNSLETDRLVGQPIRPETQHYELQLTASYMQSLISEGQEPGVAVSLKPSDQVICGDWARLRISHGVSLNA